jgi:hypothetical protein
MATWTVMADVPNPLFDSNGDPFSGAVLKAFLPGTTTGTSIAIDTSGSSPQASITYNAQGKLEVTGNEILPHIDRTHKWGIFANAVDAAANTPFYMGPFDNVEAGASGFTYDQGGTGSVTRTVTSRLQDLVSIKDFGAVGDGVTDDTVAIQAAIDFAKTTVTTVLASKITTVTSSVFIPAGTFNHTTLAVPTGVRLLGSSMAASLLSFKGTSGNAINIDKVSTEELFGVQFENLSLVNNSGVGSPRGISGDDGANLAIRKCHLKSVMIYGFDINLFLNESFTFQIDNSLIQNGTTNNAVLKNATGGGAYWTRFDVSGDSNVLIDDGSTGTETIAVTFQKCTFQSSTKWGLLGTDVVAARILDCFFEANNQSATADFGSVYFADGANTRGKHYEISGCFFSPGSGTSAQTGIKIDRAEFVELNNMIRGSGIDVGVELGVSVDICVDKNIYSGQITENSHTDTATKVFQFGADSLAPAFWGSGVTLSSFDATDANLMAGAQAGGHVLMGAYDNIGGMQGAGTGSDFRLTLNPHDGYVDSGSMISRRGVTSSNFTVTKKTPMMISLRTTGNHNFDISALTASDGGEFSFQKLNDGGQVSVVIDGSSAINGGSAGAALVITGAGTAGLYLVIGATTNDWRVVFAAEV